MSKVLSVIAANPSSVAFAESIRQALTTIQQQTEFSIQTSGSTGIPKVIVHTTQAAFTSAAATVNFLAIPKNSTGLVALPIDKTGGKMQLYRALLLDQTVIAATPAVNPLLHVTLPDKISLTSFTPMQLHHILSDEKTAPLLHRFEVVLVGGAAISSQLVAQLQKYPDTVFYETFGMTETLSHIALKNLSQDEHCFTLLPDISIQTDAEQRLVVNAPYICAMAIHTNDVVRLVSPNCFEYIARYDYVINSGGLKFFPEQIEEKLRAHLHIPFYISGQKDEILGEKIVIVMESQPIESDIESAFQRCLTKYETPKSIICAPFRYTTNGKLVREKF